MRDQRPHRFSSATDLYLTADVYDAFEGNTVEVEFLVEHLERLRLSARNVYREVRVKGFKVRVYATF
jgi:E3 ubiquitin-protein ligase CHFR